MSFENSNEGLGPGPVDEPAPVPGHQLLKCIGRGSYGTVWLARNQLGQYRAVKIVYRKSFDKQKPFDREWAGILAFEPISRSHEGFVDILQAGLDQEAGYFFYVMELGDDVRLGQNIDPDKYVAKTLDGEIKRQRRLPIDDCIRMGLALSRALGELHKHGLVHRDVKPANVIYVHGVPKLADIGLVVNQGLALSFVGTEGFVPPEGPGSAKADVYALGKLLYEASTGKDRLEFPELPSDLLTGEQGGPFLELNEVLLKACHQDASLRYASAWEAYVHLLVIADGKSVRRLIHLEKFLNLLKKAGLAAVLAVCVLGLGGVYLYRESQFRLREHQRKVDENVAGGLRDAESGNYLEALPKFAEAIRLEEESREDGFLDRLRFGSALAETPKMTSFWQEPENILDATFNHQGSRVLLAVHGGMAKLYDLKSNKMIGEPLTNGTSLNSAAISPDGETAVTAGENEKECKVRDLARHKIALRLPHEGGVFSARYSHDGSRILTSGIEGEVRVWNSHTGALELALKGHAKEVQYAEFSHDDRLIVSASRDGSVRIWDARSGHCIRRIAVTPKWVFHASFSPDDQMILTSDSEGNAKVWDLEGKPFPLAITRNMAISSAEFSPDGRFILTASFDGTVGLWNVDNLQPARPCSTFQLGSAVNAACFNPGGDSIMAVCEDGTARVWSLAAASLIPSVRQGDFFQDTALCFAVTNQTLEVRESANNRLISIIPFPEGIIRPLACTTRGGYFVSSVSRTNETGHIRSSLQVRESKNGQQFGKTIPYTNEITGAAISSQGDRLLVFTSNTAQIWDVQTGREFSPPLNFTNRLEGGEFSPDGGSCLAFAGNRVYVWNSTSGHLLFPPLAHPCDVKSSGFSHDGSLLVSACADSGLNKRFAQIWNARTGASGARVTLNDGVLFAAFSPDDRRFATGDEHYEAAIWDTASGRRVTQPINLGQRVNIVAFSSDGKLLLTAGFFGGARVWDARTGNPLTPEFGRLESITSAGFMPDGRHVITCGGHGRSWVWDLDICMLPADDIEKITCLMSNGQVGALDDQAPAASMAALWRELSPRYPQLFSATKAEIMDWHKLQAEMNMASNHPSAARFHLEQIQLLNSSGQTSNVQSKPANTTEGKAGPAAR